MEDEIIPATPTPKSPAIIDRWPTAAEKATAEFERHAGRLLPGAASRLGHMMASTLGQLTPPERAERVATFLDSPAAARWLDAEAAPPLLENGQAPGPLRQALGRYAAELKPGKVDELARAWAVDMAHKPAAKIAAEVVRRLGLTENSKHLTRPIDRAYVSYSKLAEEKARAEATRAEEKARAGDGKFATRAPIKPGRGRSSF
jgi:hypothetical protein